MKFKIQEFPGPTREAETEVYFSLRIDMDGRLILRASNTEGDPGQTILVIWVDGKIRRPQITPIEGLSLYGGHIELEIS